MARGKEKDPGDKAAGLGDQRDERVTGDPVVRFASKLQRVVVAMTAPVDDMVTVRDAYRFLQPLPRDPVTKDVDLHVAMGQDLA